MAKEVCLPFRNRPSSKAANKLRQKIAISGSNSIVLPNTPEVLMRIKAILRPKSDLKEVLELFSGFSAVYF